MKFDFIEKYRSLFAVEKMCRVLGVSRSGYYAWRERKPGKRAVENTRLFVKVNAIFEESKRTYGSPRIVAELHKEGIRCGKNRVARIMRQYNISPIPRKKFKVTTNSDHSEEISPNLVNRNFNQEAPNRVWVSDITYIWTKQGWLYLAIILDLFSRKIVGWSTSNRITASLIITAMKNALTLRQVDAGLILHSDQGCQYASKSFRQLLKDNEVAQSMSRKGNCYDNAVAESFFKTIKTELVKRTLFETRDNANLKLFDYIEIFYNRQRKHSTLNYKSPNEYELTV